MIPHSFLYSSCCGLDCDDDVLGECGNLVRLQNSFVRGGYSYGSHFGVSVCFPSRASAQGTHVRYAEFRDTPRGNIRRRSTFSGDRLIATP